MPQNRDTQHEILLFLRSNETTVNLESSPVLRVYFILKSHSILSWLVSVVKYLHKAHIHLECVAKERLYRRFVINQQNDSIRNKNIKLRVLALSLTFVL